ncbi:NEP1-interacting protein-like 2 [Neltuma alba]|uniref:NEP1-interacting protein-like 2 n=1 Tax=Neltuma alba TaxID=207710 RepID=UPI0010A4B6C5|nr:NEP1-interacting protein-like 2 [Prosopis alba]
MESETTNEARSMSKDEIEKLPCYNYAAKDSETSTVECAVCLENQIPGDKCRLLPACKHSFHAHCLDQWLLQTPICPICRASVDSQKECFAIDINESGHFEPNRTQLRESPETGFTMQSTENSTPEG